MIIGQDPHHGAGQAHGLCFSVLPGIEPPPSLKNIFKEIADDVGGTVPDNGYLVPWAKQGVLLLNTILTVREGQPQSHAKLGWQKFTDAVIRAINDKKEGVVFSGDVLFSGSIGRTDLWEGSFAQLEKSVKRKLYALPDSTKVLTGHGAPTTIGAEKKSNPYIGG